MKDMYSVAVLINEMQAVLNGEPASSRDGGHIIRFSGALRDVLGDQEKQLALGRSVLGLLIERQRAALIADQALDSAKPGPSGT